MASPRDGQWACWSASLSSSRSTADLRLRLLGIANAVASDEAQQLSLWDRLGVEVVRARLAGRRGSIIDRWDTRIAVVDDREPEATWPYIVAHETAHLLIGAVHRHGRVALARDDEERLCDEFAAQVTTIPQPAGTRAGR